MRVYCKVPPRFLPGFVVQRLVLSIIQINANELCWYIIKHLFFLFGLESQICILFRLYIYCNMVAPKTPVILYYNA